MNYEDDVSVNDLQQDIEALRGRLMGSNTFFINAILALLAQTKCDEKSLLSYIDKVRIKDVDENDLELFAAKAQYDSMYNTIKNIVS